jgi:hypothetical protein
MRDDKGNIGQGDLSIQPLQDTRFSTSSSMRKGWEDRRFFCSTTEMQE